MKIVECNRCGSPDLREIDGYVVCVYCQSRFVIPLSEAPSRGTTIGIDSDIQALLQKCKDDPSNRRRFAGLVLDLDPTNQEARRYLT